MHLKIVDIDDYVHLICGKLICYDADAFDFSDSDTERFLVYFAEKLYTEPDLCRDYGDDSVCILDRAFTNPKKFYPHIESVDSLPEVSQRAVRRYFDEQVG